MSLFGLSRRCYCYCFDQQTQVIHAWWCRIDLNISNHLLLLNTLSYPSCYSNYQHKLHLYWQNAQDNSIGNKCYVPKTFNTCADARQIVTLLMCLTSGSIFLHFIPHFSMFIFFFFLTFRLLVFESKERRHVLKWKCWLHYSTWPQLLLL